MTALEIEQRTATSTRWTVDTNETSVEFAVKTFWGLMTVHGRFDRFDGLYDVGPDGTTIELSIDADSLDTGHATRDKHLRSTDFFHVAEHPQVRFSVDPRPPRDDGDILHVVGGLEAAGRRRGARVPRDRTAARRRARDRGDDDGRPAAARDEQRPARHDPSAGDAARQGTAEPMTARDPDGRRR